MLGKSKLLCDISFNTEIDFLLERIFDKYPELLEFTDSLDIENDDEGLSQDILDEILDKLADLPISPINGIEDTYDSKKIQDITSNRSKVENTIPFNCKKCCESCNQLFSSMSRKGKKQLDDKPIFQKIEHHHHYLNGANNSKKSKKSRFFIYGSYFLISGLLLFIECVG